MRQPGCLSSLVLVVAMATGCRGRDPAPTLDASVGPPPGADGGPGPGGDEVGAPGLSRSALLEAVGACALQTAREAMAKAYKLAEIVQELETRPDARDQARAAFREALDVWQIAEAMQFGPAARKDIPGGAGMRDFIYAFPAQSRCSVEETLVANSFRSPDFLSTALVNRRGFGALEYLLFFESSPQTCAASPALAMLPAEEREARKRAYAALLAGDLLARMQALGDAWDASKGNHLATLATAGPGNAVYPTTKVAFNAVGHALFYVERDVKDIKLAQPLGLRECMAETCPELLESQFAGRSKANVRANLAGFRRLIEGCGPDFSGVGFDDLLQALNAGTVATTMHDRILAAGAALDAIEEPDLRPALAADKPSVRALYDALKGITDLVKTQFRTVLDIDLPTDLATDND